MENNKHFDVIVVGGSYSGLAAAMALGRSLRKVLIIDSGKPCNRQTPYSHNFLTQDGKSPFEIAALGKQQLAIYSTVEFFNGLAVKIGKAEGGFIIGALSGELFNSKKIIFATGIKDQMPDIPGFSECWGISALHCPYCHGYEVRNQPTGIIGNGDYGFEFSKLISNWTDELTLFTNGQSTLTGRQVSDLERWHIDVVDDEITELEHINGQLNAIIFNNGSKASVKAIYSRLPFQQHCQLPKEFGCELTEHGFIRIDNVHRTSVDGIFACGDNVSPMRTVANAVSMGTTTGMMVNKELIEEDLTVYNQIQ
jgi:thioredoxin reductase